MYFQKLGTAENTRLEIAKNLPTFTDHEAQERLSLAISEGKLGTTDTIKEALLERLPEFTATQAQRTLAMAIHTGQFGSYADTVNILTKQLHKFTDPTANRLLAFSLEKAARMMPAKEPEIPTPAKQTNPLGIDDTMFDALMAQPNYLEHFRDNFQRITKANKNAPLSYVQAI
jgi:hypothetical protein